MQRAPSSDAAPVLLHSVSALMRRCWGSASLSSLSFATLFSWSFLVGDDAAANASRRKVMRERN